MLSKWEECNDQSYYSSTCHLFIWFISRLWNLKPGLKPGFKKYVEYFFRLCIFFFCLKLLLNLWTPVPHPSLITWSVFYQSVKLHVVILFEVLPVRQRSYCWHTHLHCVSLLLWQMSCSVAIFNWQICQLCINLCKLPRPYLVPEMAPGLRFHPMAQPVGHAGEMTRNWRQLRVVTPWHTLNKQLWALYY